jgi:hypothetical protein
VTLVRLGFVGPLQTVCVLHEPDQNSFFMPWENGTHHNEARYDAYIAIGAVYRPSRLLGCFPDLSSVEVELRERSLSG